jgi:hypothetical protein
MQAFFGYRRRETSQKKGSILPIILAFHHFKFKHFIYRRKSTGGRILVVRASENNIAKEPKFNLHGYIFLIKAIFYIAGGDKDPSCRAEKMKIRRREIYKNLRSHKP